MNTPSKVAAVLLIAFLVLWVGYLVTRSNDCDDVLVVRAFPPGLACVVEAGS